MWLFKLLLLLALIISWLPGTDQIQFLSSSFVEQEEVEGEEETEEELAA